MKFSINVPSLNCTKHNSIAVRCSGTLALMTVG